MTAIIVCAVLALMALAAGVAIVAVIGGDDPEEDNWTTDPFIQNEPIIDPDDIDFENGDPERWPARAKEHPHV